jgi:membrane protease YdiL (CAAX protease family)
VILVLLTTAVSLTLQQYLFQSTHLPRALDLLCGPESGQTGDRVCALLKSPENEQLAGLVYWALGTLVTYVVIPALVITLAFRDRLRDYGMKVRGMFSGCWVYLAFFAVLFPCLVYFSHTAGFQAKYPFYRLAADEPLWPRFWIWELFYAMQFFCLEFFFRGFVLHGTRHRFGAYAIFVMMVPYCMIHYGKPLPETIGAIGAGVVLGFMSLKTRSVWLGAVLHVGVALSMDMLSLWHKGLLP